MGGGYEGGYSNRCRQAVELSTGPMADHMLTPGRDAAAILVIGFAAVRLARAGLAHRLLCSLTRGLCDLVRRYPRQALGSTLLFVDRDCYSARAGACLANGSCSSSRGCTRGRRWRSGGHQIRWHRGSRLGTGCRR